MTERKVGTSGTKGVGGGTCGSFGVDVVAVDEAARVLDCIMDWKKDACVTGRDREVEGQEKALRKCCGRRSGCQDRRARVSQLSLVMCMHGCI